MHSISLIVNLHYNEEEYVKDIILDDKFEWSESEYAWFAIKGIAGGTDGYCDKIQDDSIEPENPWWILDDLIRRNRTIVNIDRKLIEARRLDRRWTFRRSAGQSGIVALSYGLISASVAELTKGIIWSDDSAWDYQRFPAESKDMLEWYFEPAKALEPDNAVWAQECMDGISEELTTPDSTLPKAGRTWWQKIFGVKP